MGEYKVFFGFSVRPEWSRLGPNLELFPIRGDPGCRLGSDRRGTEGGFSSQFQRDTGSAGRGCEAFKPHSARVFDPLSEVQRLWYGDCTSQGFATEANARVALFLGAAAGGEIGQ